MIEPLSHVGSANRSPKYGNSKLVKVENLKIDSVQRKITVNDIIPTANLSAGGPSSRGNSPINVDEIADMNGTTSQ